MSHDQSPRTNAAISRRTALRAGVAASAAVTVGAVDPKSVVAQDATPPAGAAWRREDLAFDFIVTDPVFITRAGGGPPQRGDTFYIDGRLYASGDSGGTEIGTYQCFGAWTAPASATDAADQRLTSVQYRFADGIIAGLINEGGADQSAIDGTVMGGTGRYLGALGTFYQEAVTPLTPATPEGATGTPAPPSFSTAVRFELLLPNLGM